MVFVLLQADAFGIRSFDINTCMLKYSLFMLIFLSAINSCPDGILQAELYDGDEWNVCQEMINLNLASQEIKNWLPDVPSTNADHQSLIYIPG